MRIRPLRAVAAVLLPLVLAGACSGSNSGNLGLAPGTIAAAAVKTVAAKSARIHMVITIAAPKEAGGSVKDVSFVAEGRMQIGKDRGVINVDMGSLGLPGQAGKVEMRIIDTIAYMKIPAVLAGEIPAGKTWMKIDYGALSKKQGVDLGAVQRNFQTGDPADILGFLKGAGSVSKLGTEDVRGTRTTHYKATVDFAKVIEQAAEADRADLRKLSESTGLKKMPMEAWIGDDGLLRRMQFTMDMSNLKSSSQNGKMTMRMELYDFGVAVGDVVAPPASETIDLAKMMERQQ